MTEATEIVGAPDAEVRNIREFRLEVIDGPDRGKQVRARRDRLVVGTHESTDFTLTDRSLSRFHCELAMRGGDVIIRDLDSRNGTRVDDVAVHQAPLRDGAVLTLGRTRLRFALGTEQVSVRASPRTSFGLLRGRSQVMRELFAVLEGAARGDATVLLHGETGVGKDVAARSIHAESARRGGPFVVIDCGAIPASLLESELFGHERGAFTGADRLRPGAFESAGGGTIFLDEIGQLALELQPKLLRVLESRQLRRIGSNRPIAIDVRVICATNRRLHELVNRREFRADLFYRIAVIEVEIPPLRERRDDVAELVDVLLDAMQVSTADAAFLRSDELQAELRRHAWPGNVRELRNYLERCVLLRGRAPLSRGDDEAPPLIAGETLKQARDRWLGALERRFLEELLRETGGDLAEVARRAGIGRAYLYRLIARHRLR